MKIKKINRCRICGSKNLEHIFELKNQKLTGIFPKNHNQNNILKSSNITLVRCQGKNSCGFVQTHEIFNKTIMFGKNYGYESSLNPSMKKHLQIKMKRLKSKYKLKRDNFIIDIGSNDGTSLNTFPKNFKNLIGIDPTSKYFREKYNENINVYPNFFNKLILKKALSKNKVKLFTSFSMFYDIENPNEFVKTISNFLDKDGIWVTEQSYLPLMLKFNSFDTICHEHLGYYSIYQFEYILKKFDLKIINIEENDINGGSHSLEIVNVKSNFPINSSVKKYRQKERLFYERDDVFKNFKKNIELQKFKFLDFINKKIKDGKKIYGIGASTKGNVLLQHYSITSKQLLGIGEININKLGSYTPGSMIPILSEEEVLKSNPDYLVVLPWHFKNFFLKNKKFKNQKLIFPLPTFKIIKT